MAEGTDGGVLGAVNNADGAGDAPGGTAGQGGMPGGAPAGGGADWGFLPDGLQSLSEGFDKPEAFWAEVSQLKAMSKERQAVTGAKPESLVSEQDWNDFWKAAGRPDSPDGYKLPESWSAEGVAPEIAQAVSKTLAEDFAPIKEAFHKANLTGKQAEALYGVLGNLVADGIQDDLAGQRSDAEIIKEVWPENTDQYLDAARRGARHAGLGSALDEAGLSKHPLVLKLAQALGEAVGEAGLPGGRGGGEAGLPRGQEAREEMYRVIASDAYKNNDPAAVRKVEALARRVAM